MSRKTLSTKNPYDGRSPIRWHSVLMMALMIAVWGLNTASKAPRVLGQETDDPRVEAMVEKGVSFLEKSQPDERLGGACIAAMAVFKYRHNPESPIVQHAVQKCRSVIANPNLLSSDGANYSLGIAVIFLCELDPQTYAREIQALMDMVVRRQRPDGAWSYPNYETGDTSQTQYGALSSWIAIKRGFQVPQSTIERYCNWLIRVQDPSGQWPYQGTDHGQLGNRIPQPQRLQAPAQSYRMSPAALGSLYIAADLLKIPMKEGQRGPQEVFRKASEATTGSVSSNVDPGLLRRAIQDGVRVYENNFRIDVFQDPGGTPFQYYYLYSLERYKSLREKLENISDKNPVWYKQGVDLLAKNQASDGSWNDNSGHVPSTAFAVLFLIRATKKIIASEGALRGGHSLPEDLTKIKVEDGNVVSTEVAGDLGSLMEMINSGEGLDSDALIAQIDSIQFGNKKKPQPTQAEMLKKMVSGENYLARLLAVRALANSGDLNNAPILIYALGDGDWRVAKEARDGLRLVTRRISGFGMPDRPTPAQQRAEQLAWRDWLKAIKPDLVVPDEFILDPSAASSESK